MATCPLLMAITTRASYTSWAKEIIIWTSQQTSLLPEMSL
jgi:hypothetical protein